MADNCKPCNCNPCTPPSFPAMSAHFAHTLDDMEEKYVRIQFIEIDAPSGTLDEEKLKTLTLSRENKIVYENCIYNLTLIEEDLYTYISIRVKEENYLEFNKLVLNKTTGEYSITVVKTKEGEKIQELSYDLARTKQDLDQVKLNINALENKVSEKVNVSIERDPDNEKDIILKIFR